MARLSGRQRLPLPVGLNYAINAINLVHYTINLKTIPSVWIAWCLRMWMWMLVLVLASICFTIFCCIKKVIQHFRWWPFFSTAIFFIFYFISYLILIKSHLGERTNPSTYSLPPPQPIPPTPINHLNQISKKIHHQIGATNQPTLCPSCIFKYPGTFLVLIPTHILMRCKKPSKWCSTAVGRPR